MARFRRCRRGPRYRQTFARLLGFLRPYKVSLIVSIVLAVGSQGAQIALVWLTEHVIDSALEPHDREKLWLYVGAVLALGLVRAVLMAGRRLISGRQALAVEMDMRQGLYAHLVRLSFGFYDRHQTGQLMSRATVDLQGVRFFLGYGLIFFFQNVLTVVSVTVVLLVFQWKLALIALAITPVLVALAYRYSHVAHPTLREVQQKLADVATVAEENIVGVHVVKSFAQEPQESAKFHARSEDVFQQTIRANRQRATYVPLIAWIPLLAQAAVLLVGARMVTSGELTVGTLRRLQPLPRHARHAAAVARHVDRPVAARDRVGRADLPGHGRARGDRRAAGRGRAAARRRASSASRTCASSTSKGGPCSTASRSTCRPAGRSR